MFGEVHVWTYILTQFLALQQTLWVDILGVSNVYCKDSFTDSLAVNNSYRLANNTISCPEKKFNKGHNCWGVGVYIHFRRSEPREVRRKWRVCRLNLASLKS